MGLICTQEFGIILSQIKDLSIGMLPLILAILTAVLSGCTWSPTRDNKVDPASPYYDPALLPNRAPRIDSLSIVTDCLANVYADYCAFEVRCSVSDADNNLMYNEIMARLDTIELGPMSYDPELGYFYLRREQSDFSWDNLRVFEFDTVRVSVRDDSGATDSKWVLFPRIDRNYPQIQEPDGTPTFPDTVFQDQTTLRWSQWRETGGDYFYSVAVYLEEAILVWDSTGIASDCTSVVVGDSLLPSYIVPYLYKWYLSVTDEVGNRRTAQPSYFFVYPLDSTLVQSPPENARGS
jgi:hypothetical protein